MKSTILTSLAVAAALYLVFFACWILSNRNTKSTADEQQKIARIVPDNFPTAFVNGHRTFPFRPTTEQIKKVELQLQKYLEKNRPELKKIDSYYRQYTGFKTNGSPDNIRANFLCEVNDDQWKKEWIMVFDGGDCYFNFSFNVNTSEITDFSTNGNA